MTAQFIVYALPRSRTYWLSQYLSHAGWHVGHDEMRRARTIEDVKTWLSIDHFGTVETGASPFWRLVGEIAPSAKVATIRRDPADVIASLLKTGYPFDRANLTTIIRRMDAKLDQIEARVPNVLSLSFDDLNDEVQCRALGEHLGVPHRPERLRFFSSFNLQLDFQASVREVAAFQPQTDRLRRSVAQHMRAKIMGRPLASAEFCFQQESLATLLKDGADLISEHMVVVGEVPDGGISKNLPVFQRLEDAGALHITTARHNGRMLAYVISFVTPSLSVRGEQEGYPASFYTSPLAPGLGLKLQRAAVAHLRTVGVDKAFFRAGVRGSGPRMGALYRRLGAEPFGEMFTLDLKETA